MRIVRRILHGLLRNGGVRIAIFRMDGIQKGSRMIVKALTTAPHTFRDGTDMRASPVLRYRSSRTFLDAW